MRIKPVSVAFVVYQIVFNTTFYLAVFHGNDGVKELMNYIFSILTAICLASAIFIAVLYFISKFIGDAKLADIEEKYS
ncbi:hypothetical protein ABWH69_02285 [Pasteurella multocida]